MNETARVLVLRAGGLGDTVFCTVLMDALWRHFDGNVRFDWIVTRSVAGLFACDARVDRVFVLNRGKRPIWLSREKQYIARSSRDRLYDLFINAETGRQFAGLATRIHARQKLSISGAPPFREPGTYHAVCARFRSLYWRRQCNAATCKS